MLCSSGFGLYSRRGAPVLSSSQFKRCMGRGESKKRAERGLEWGSEKTVSHLLDLQNVQELRLTRKTM